MKPDPRQWGVKIFIVKRLVSLRMVATVAFLLLVWLVVSAVLSAVGESLGVVFGSASKPLMQMVQPGLSLVVITGLFAGMLKVLSDARVAWPDALIGAVFTAVLFVAGKCLICFYLAQSDPGSSFGAAAALAVILVWIYYSTMIVFLGAELTQAWAVLKGSGIEPDEGAIRIEGRRAQWRARPI